MLPKFVPGALNRVDTFRHDPSGKGLNVSSALLNFGVDSVAFCLLGGGEGKFIYDVLSSRGVNMKVIWTERQTRIGIKVFEEETGTLTEINERGTEVGDEDLASLTTSLRESLQPGDILVLSGSIPKGVPKTIYADLVRLAKESGARPVVDADGEVMKLALEEGPYLIKPNDFEAGQILGRTLETDQDALQAARELTRHSEMVVLTLGARGAVLAFQERLIRVFPPHVKVKSSVGCGDTFLAAVLASLQKGMSLDEVARFASAAGGAAAELEGTNFPDQAHVERLLEDVRVEVVDYR